MKNALAILVFLTFSNSLSAEEYDEWGSYVAGDWEWKVIIIPKDTTAKDLLNIAKSLYKKNPKTRMRFFDDDGKVQQFVDRDRYFNDSTGTVPEVPFPETWVIAHHKANINERSQKARNRWQLVTRYGEHIAYLE